MNGRELVARIVSQGFVETAGGERLRLHSGTSIAQCEFVAGLVGEIKPVKSVEIGLAFGISTLYICEQLIRQEHREHIVCDPFQHDHVWQGAGLANLAIAGYGDIVRFVEESGDRVVARMALADERIQFCYIDADKRFDSNLVYFWWLDKVLDVGGVLVWDDCDWPSLRRLARLVASHPNYSVCAVHGSPRADWKQRAWHWAALVHRVGNVGRIAADARHDRSLGIDHHCIAFRKISDRAIDWDWYPEF